MTVKCEEDVSKRLLIEGEWMGEIVEISLRKVRIYGLPYEAVATVKIVDGKAHVVNLLSGAEQPLARKDFDAVQKMLARLGVPRMNFRRFHVAAKSSA